jgi:hypothetical protein
MLYRFSNRLINTNYGQLKIYRNNMHTAGTATKIPTVFFFVLVMPRGFRDRALYFITAIICTSAGYARQ